MVDVANSQEDAAIWVASYFCTTTPGEEKFEDDPHSSWGWNSSSLRTVRWEGYENKTNCAGCFCVQGALNVTISGLTISFQTLKRRTQILHSFAACVEVCHSVPFAGRSSR